MMAAVAVLLAAVAVLLTQVLRSQGPVEVVSTPAQSTSAPAQPSPVATQTVIVATTTTAAAPLPVGTWITVLESLPKTEFSLAQAEAKAAALSAVGRPVSVIDSDATPGLNKGFWALGVTGSSSREAAAAQCAAFGRQAGGTCYPRQVG